MTGPPAPVPPEVAIPSTWTSAGGSRTIKGVFLPDSFWPDNLHPQAKGYDIWGEAVSAKVAELVK
jgi:lysophospholipase L1-like esterase